MLIGEFGAIQGTVIGNIAIAATEEAITNLWLPNAVAENFPASGDNFFARRNSLIKEAFAELTEYLTGRRQIFSLPLTPHGTFFQQQVWQAMLEIPFGETVSYGEIAARIACPQACRAVGGACHRNPIAIFIPCHRVIAAAGRMGGFGGGLQLKEWLLAHERRNP